MMLRQRALLASFVVSVALAFLSGNGWGSNALAAPAIQNPDNVIGRPSAATPEATEPLSNAAAEMDGLARSTSGRLADKPFVLKPLPAEPDMRHEQTSILRLGKAAAEAGSRMPLLLPVQLEASYSRPLTLQEALQLALQNSLPIKISRQSWKYQRWQLVGALINAVPIPSMGMSYNLTKSNILSSNTTSNSTVFSTTVRYPVFQGGGAVMSAIAQRYREQGWKHAYYAGVNDALLDVYQRYTNLQLQYALLQIREKAAQVSEAQLNLNNALYQAGTGTQLAIMQSRTQLAADREALMEQQVTVHLAALGLSWALDLPMEINLVPEINTISETAIIDTKLCINDLLNIAMANRPELRQYEYFRLAANRNIHVAASALYPSASFFTSYTHSQTTVGSSASRAAAAAQAAVAQSQANSNSSSGSSSQSSSSFANTAGAGVFGGLFNTYQAGFSLSWGLSNMGLSAAVNIASAQVLARQAMLQANQELLLVIQQVRSDYSSALAARGRIDNAAYGVISAREALRLANLRLASGMGTNVDSIQAERDYINALVTQAQAIIGSNTAQAQLLHDLGVISIGTLLGGYHPSATTPLQRRRIRI